MITLYVSILNAQRLPLDDRSDVTIINTRTNQVVFHRKDTHGSIGITFQNTHQTYLIRVFPARHRPVSQFVMASDGDVHVQMFCPVDPHRVFPLFPPYADLDPALQKVLKFTVLSGSLEGTPPQPPGTLIQPITEAFYNSLEPLQQAGLLNIFCKMRHTFVGEQIQTWNFVQRLHRLRADRIFAHVAIDFRDHIKSAIASGQFTEVSGALHTPPVGYQSAGSFKTNDRYGNLQVTFFSTLEQPLKFLADIDIDDAAGIEHAFQVINHAVTKGDTHPFDIHQLLTFYQGLNPGYTLST